MIHLRKASTILIFVLLLTFASVIVNTSSRDVFAGNFTSVQITKTSFLENTTGVDYTISFTTASSATLTEISFQYATSSGGSTKPANLDLTASSLGTVSGLNASWSLDKSQASVGVLNLSNASGELINSSSSITVKINNVSNPKVGDCDGSATFSDTCYVGITSYDATNTSIDSGNGSFTFQKDPSISFTVASVNSGVTVNGITTTQPSDYNLLPFGHMLAGERGYVSQKITVSTDALHGYSVYVTNSNALQGLYSGDYISPFTGNSASWSSPATWASPIGTVAGTNTGWIGINTSDTRVPNWGSSSAKFAPLDSSSHLIMYSSGSDSGTDAYITYGLEVNVYNPADSYSGTINYTVIPTY